MKKISLFVILVITFALFILLPEKSFGQKTSDTQFIQAEVKGILHFQEGRGYFISVKSSRVLEHKNQVWLWIAEDKLLIRKLEGLLNKTVIAKGELDQMPENSGAIILPQSMFFNKFQIEEAKDKNP